MTSSSRRRRPLASLVVLFVALVATGGLYSVLAPASRAEAAAPAGADAVEEGKRLFLANCSSCHGKNAQGGTDGPSLVGVGAASVDFQVATGRMPLAARAAQAPRGRVLFTQPQINALAAYVASLGPGPAIPSPEQYSTEGLTDEEVAEGGEIFRTNCAMCHNFAGSGGALTQGKYAPSLAGTDPRHIYEAMLTGPQSMPVFNDRVLSEKDKKQVIAFIERVNEETAVGGATLGNIGPVSEGLVAWIVGIGGLIAAAVWLGAKSA